MNPSLEASLQRHALLPAVPTTGLRTIVWLLAALFACGAANGQTGPADAAMAAETSHAGLWVGTVTVDAVDDFSRPDADAPAPAAGDFTFRLIVHVGDGRQARLVRRVVMLTGGGEDLALYSDPLALQAAAERRRAADPEALIETRGLSTPAFGFSPPFLPMTGRIEPGAALRIDIPVRRDDPANPFAHRAHPQHDGEPDNIPPEPGEGVGEIYDIVRRLTFTLPGETGEDEGIISGRYSETIEGLSAVRIRASGSFELRRAFENAELDP
jgi:hypothetical protein